VNVAPILRTPLPPFTSGSRSSVRRRVGSAGRSRTYDQPVNSRLLYH
jgi:hypothetical protein